MQQVELQLDALEKHKKLIREHREKDEKLRERNISTKITHFHYNDYSTFWNQGFGT